MQGWSGCIDNTVSNLELTGLSHPILPVTLRVIYVGKTEFRDRMPMEGRVTFRLVRTMVLREVTLGEWFGLEFCWWRLMTNSLS